MRRIKTSTASLFLLLAALLPFANVAKAQYAANSVLATGNWWKVEIGDDGIYSITTSDINGLEGCNINDIAVFGEKGGILDVDNSSQRIDDLTEMAIRIVDNNGNGIFDANDRVLFFATGSVRWSYDDNLGQFTHKGHPYSTSNYVFVTVANAPHRRIQSQQLLPSASVVTSCHVLRLHESDLTNTHRTGQIWVGERFYGSTTTHNISIPLPAQAIGNVKVRYALASISTSAASFSVSSNGTTRNRNFNSSTNYGTFADAFPAGGNTALSISFKYDRSENMASGYLDYVEVDAEVQATFNGDMTLIYLPPAADTVVRCHISGAGNNTRVWDVTDYNSVTEMQTSLDNGTLCFSARPDRWRSFILFNDGSFKQTLSANRIQNQDLHGTPAPDMVIVSSSSLMEQAQRLASIHSIEDNIDVLVVDQQAVFNEFSSGQADPMAVREMLRMFRNKAIASGSDEKPRYLLLFGKGTYDNRDLMGKGLPTVITYQTATSFDDDGISMATDDVFTYLDNNEAASITSTMDVAVGRLPAKNASEAAHLVNKIERYITRGDLLQSDIRGDWRNCIALLADDADPSCGGDTVFTSSSEFIARNISETYPHITIDKIYADAYVQQSGSDGSYYPDVNNALDKRINYGCLLLNYIGHGSSQYIGTERFLMKSHIPSFSNYSQLPFFVTSTCTFGRFDDPDETCGAEEFLLASGAGVGCLAASRPISHIQAVNNDMVMNSLNPNNTIGDAVRKAKNTRPTTQSLTLIGDPALKLSHPVYNVTVTKINGHPVDSLHPDTALVLSTVTVEGEIRDKNGLIVSDFEGDIYPEVYDRARTTKTLANDNDGYEVTFSVQNSLLYRGHATVSGGRFSYRFTVPRDVAFKFERARLSHYAKSATVDASGAYTNLYLGGFDETVDISETRPTIHLFLNDTNFRNGGVTDASPTLLAMLFDSVGINAVGSGLGHDITATLDGNPNNIIILNDFYETDIHDEHWGTIRYNLSNLTAGKHHLSVKVWNIFNYSNSSDITFYVHNADTTSTQFNAAPNPATDRVAFRMEHNCKGGITDARLDIFDIQGRCVKSFTPTPSADSYVVGPIEWNLCDSEGHRVRPGVYIARFITTTNDGDKLVENGKLIVK